MFVQKISGLDKNRFGVNFKAEDIKCKAEEKVLKKELFKNNGKLGDMKNDRS